MNSEKLIYINNLRVFIISLVVVFHLALFYMPFSWYCCTELASPWLLIFLTAFTTICQTFFMGLLFFVAAYFTNHSFNKAAMGMAFNKRLIRLGAPILFYLFIISPLVYYLPILINQNASIPYPHVFNLGHLWFIASLLVFTVIYAFIRKLNIFDFCGTRKIELPNALIVLFFSLLLGLSSFVVRIWFPVGDKLPIINTQLAHFPQYVSLFILGIVAYKFQWLESVHLKSLQNWLLYAFALILLAVVLLAYVGGEVAKGGVTHEDIPELLGGWNMASLLYSTWEQLTGIPLMIGLVGFFKHYFNRETQLSRWLSENSYTMYIIHLPIIVLLSLLMGKFDLPISIKFLLLIIPSLVICFVIAHWVKKIPILTKII